MVSSSQANKNGAPGKRAYFGAKITTRGSPTRKLVAPRSGPAFKGNIARTAILGAPVSTGKAGRADYREMSALSKELGQKLAMELNDPLQVERLREMNAKLDAVRLQNRQPAQNETNFIKTLNLAKARAPGWQKESKAAWRAIAKGTDEFVSTATIIGMLDGMRPQDIDLEGVKLALKILSGPRLPTRQVGYSIKGKNDSLQHPSSEERFFSERTTGQGRMDTERRLRVLDAGNSATGADRIFKMTSTAIVESLGRFASAPSASNIGMLNHVTVEDRNEATVLREHLKSVNAVLIDTHPGVQEDDAAWIKQSRRERLPAASSEFARSTSPFRIPNKAASTGKYFGAST